jgi:hypothetical protein
MSEHRQGEPAPRPPAVREHPKPPPAGVSSLNHAIRQELWYLDTVVATPFRTLRRALEQPRRRSALAEGLDELLWAAEGMTRLPVKVLQAAFGEPLGTKTGSVKAAEANRSGDDEPREDDASGPRHRH